jgi:hypothetical protein
MRIPRDKRKLESQILAEFEQLKPRILGYIFDVLVKALQIRPNLRLNDLPRMADFALWGEAISQDMGYDPLEFINAYYENIGRQNIEAVESHHKNKRVMTTRERIRVPECSKALLWRCWRYWRYLHKITGLPQIINSGQNHQML